MPTVRLLDEHSISRIAAGEVILHPAMAVKELVENALDAGATHVDVAITGGGLEMVRVTDDGCGMDEENCLLALERHATSKIRSADDIETVYSFGFRGEAMPAMAAISRMEILTRPAELETGLRVRLQGGEMESVEAAAARTGTTITLSNLFYNAPVRRRFQKAERTETMRVVDLISRYILTRPDVAFRLEVDGAVRLVTREGSDLRENIAALYGAEFARGLLPFDHEVMNPELGTLRISGWTSGPDLVRGSSKWQFLFVNGRPVENKTVSQALREAYSPILAPRKFPAAFMFMEIDPRRIDINVHPTKKDVLFTQERPIFGFVLRAVTSAFGGLDLRAAMRPEPVIPFRPEPAGDDAGLQQDLGIRIPERAQPREVPRRDPLILATPAVNPSPASGSLPAADVPGPVARDMELPEAALAEAAQRAPLSVAEVMEEGVPERYRIAGQVYETFLLVETPEGILLIDQHVASERVNYERLQARADDRDATAQGLLVPVVIEVGATDKVRMEGNLEKLAEQGFLVEPFGPGTFAVKEVPAWLGDRLDRGAMRELLTDLAERLPRTRDDIRHHVLAEAACKQSIKAGEALSGPQMRHLVEALFKCANPWRCPHGRPIILRLPMSDMLRRFGRM